ncbi:MAG: hypothetical protein IJ839_07575 [Ruminobacter sp.]|nr:hypothetical protein [Ruminobacter sp.]
MTSSLKTFWSASPKVSINIAPSFTLAGTALKLASSLSMNTSVNAGLVSEFKQREVKVAVNLGISNEYSLGGNQYAYGIDNATSKNYFLSHSKTYLGHAKLILVESAKKVELNAPKTNISVTHGADDPSALFKVVNSYLDVSYNRCVMCAPANGGNINLNVGGNSFVDLKRSGITLQCGSSIQIKSETELPDVSIGATEISMLSNKVKVNSAAVQAAGNQATLVIIKLSDANLNP